MQDIKIYNNSQLSVHLVFVRHFQTKRFRIQETFKTYELVNVIWTLFPWTLQRKVEIYMKFKFLLLLYASDLRIFLK
jgi:hypothetical protein